MNSSTRRTLLIALVAVAVVVTALVVVARRSATSGSSPLIATDLPRTEVTVLQGSVRAAERLELKAPAPGKIVALGAGEGLSVATDQLVVQIDSAAAREALRAAQASLRQAQARVRQSRAGKIRERLSLAETHLQSATAQRQQVEKTLAGLRAQQPAAATALEASEQAEKVAALAAKDYAAASAAADAAQRKANATGKANPDLERLQNTFRQRRAMSNEAQGHLNAARENRTRLRETIEQLARLQRNVDSARSLEQGFVAQLQRLRQSPEAKAALDGDKPVQAALAAVRAAEDKLLECAVKAPQAGRLAELRVRPGSAVQAGQTLAVLELQGGARMVFEVPTPQGTSVAVGKHAQVSPEGWKPFAAIVSQVAPGPQQTRVYLQPLGKTPLPPAGTALVARLR